MRPSSPASWPCPGRPTGAAAGITFRQSVDTSSPFVSVVVSAGHGVLLEHRDATGGAVVSQTFTGLTAPVWVKLVRSGNSFSAFTSSDGNAWTTAGNVTVVLNTAVPGRPGRLQQRPHAPRSTASISAVTVTAGISGVMAPAAPSDLLRQRRRRPCPTRLGRPDAPTSRLHGQAAAPTAASTWTTLGSVGSNVTTYFDSQISSGVTYAYQVIAFNFSRDLGRFQRRGDHSIGGRRSTAARRVLDRAGDSVCRAPVGSSRSDSRSGRLLGRALGDSTADSFRSGSDVTASHTFVTGPATYLVTATRNLRRRVRGHCALGQPTSLLAVPASS